MTLEKERRKLEVDLNRNERHRDEGAQKKRSASADRLHERRKHYGRQLLKNGMSSAYNTSKVVQGKSNAEEIPSESEFEKVLLLQKLLLAKTKLLSEKEVVVEGLEKKNQDLSQQVSRLKKSRFLAEELTETRHRLSTKTNQLEVTYYLVTNCLRPFIFLF